MSHPFRPLPFAYSPRFCGECSIREDLHPIMNHGHECRDCNGTIVCDAPENRNGCMLWNGSNDGCPECHPEHDAECATGFRCTACYDDAMERFPLPR